MCTVILWRGEGRCCLAANRDERLDRAWDPPGPFWPGVTGGRDRSAGGTWMALNRHGIVAAVLNRPGTLGPAAGKRSRGELPVLALQAATAAEASARIAALPAGEWRPFHMVIADAQEAFFLRGLGTGVAEATPLPEGVSMVTAHPPNDRASPRTTRHLPRFQAASPPRLGDWGAWPTLLADSTGAAAEALNVPPLGGFGTVCASLVALERGGREWLFAPGPPDRTPFEPVALG
ncbi:NRDE family protein [Sabulicella glaciei]|uniref:NRDE family protein n=1 Tax=Sabulicella glaciei TaxID=2984948 RepID=A0ABT3NSR4_9PROT|nr:NRDE family protein [Roseococcus sp. MDT2-1-1]MCW8085200.1 NRDE family protein [Roseococcus sp. MDT2-1-1]